MVRVDKNFNEALENVLNSGGHDEAIKFLIGHDRSREEAEAYLSKFLGSNEVTEEELDAALASDYVNETPSVDSVQGMSEEKTESKEEKPTYKGWFDKIFNKP
mgnify:FL=1